MNTSSSLVCEYPVALLRSLRQWQIKAMVIGAVLVVLMGFGAVYHTQRVIALEKAVALAQAETVIVKNDLKAAEAKLNAALIAEPTISEAARVHIVDPVRTAFNNAWKWVSE